MKKNVDRKLVIIGAGGHGKVVANIAVLNGYTRIVFLDDNELVKVCAGFSVVGKVGNVLNYPNYDFVVAIGNPYIRENIMSELLENKMNIVTLIHPNTTLAENVRIGMGTVIDAGAIINPEVEIGVGCIINTGATIDHDDILKDYVHVSVGSHIAGTVEIGKRTWIGIGAVVSNNLTICEDCMIGAGAVVVNDINKAGTYVGIPAKKLKRD